MKNCRIGILTFHRALNYGAVWQCWALKRVCESFGCEVETIDYNPFGHYTILGAIRHRPSVAYRYVKQLYSFNRFVNLHLNPTQHTESYDWIKQNPPKDDIYIVGSDQVWANDVVGDFLDPYLFDFAPKHVKRIAYAASTAGNKLDLTDIQLNELRKFSAISLRERQSVDDVQSMVTIPVTDVCDPTMLLIQSDYHDVEQKKGGLPEHYVAFFNLSGDMFCEEAAKLMGSSLGLPVVNMMRKFKPWANYNYLATTPEQWLYILHHADYVCTNSFHGVALSIVFRRPFVYCEAQDKRHSKRIGRIHNLLDQTNLMSRYADNLERVKSIINDEMVFDHMAIDIYRNRSLDWLNNAICS